MDKLKRYKCAKRVIVPIEKKIWIDDRAEFTHIRVHIEFYITQCIDKNMILVGRPGLRKLGIASYEKESLKKLMYIVKNEGLKRMVPNINDELDEMELKGTGPPGLYLLNENGRIDEIQTVRNKKEYKVNLIRMDEEESKKHEINMIASRRANDVKDEAKAQSQNDDNMIASTKVNNVAMDNKTVATQKQLKSMTAKNRKVVKAIESNYDPPGLQRA
eukprot:796091_1